MPEKMQYNRCLRLSLFDKIAGMNRIIRLNRISKAQEIKLLNIWCIAGRLLWPAKVIRDGMQKICFNDRTDDSVARTIRVSLHMVFAERVALIFPALLHSAFVAMGSR